MHVVTAVFAADVVLYGMQNANTMIMTGDEAKPKTLFLLSFLHKEKKEMMRTGSTSSSGSSDQRPFVANKDRSILLAVAFITLWTAISFKSENAMIASSSSSLSSSFRPEELTIITDDEKEDDHDDFAKTIEKTQPPIVSIPNRTNLIATATTTTKTTIGGNDNMTSYHQSRMIPKPSSDYVVPILKKDQIMQKGTSNAPIVIEKYKLIFFSIQKVGGTVWKQLFKRVLGRNDWRTGKTWGKDSVSGLHSLYRYSVEEATQMMNDPNWTKAIMVREPKERFLSAYLDKGFKTDYAYQRCCRFPERYKTEKTCPKAKERKTNQFTFEEFMNLTETCHDTHWLPQSRRIQSKFLPLLNWVGHMETAYDDAYELLTHVGIWEEFGKSGWGIGQNESIFQSTSNVKHKTDDHNANAKSNSRLAQYYTPELERRMEQRLQTDYDISQFGLQLIKIKY